jgi:hypothetical protein
VWRLSYGLGLIPLVFMCIWRIWFLKESAVWKGKKQSLKDLGEQLAQWPLLRAMALLWVGRGPLLHADRLGHLGWAGPSGSMLLGPDLAGACQGVMAALAGILGRPSGLLGLVGFSVICVARKQRGPAVLQLGCCCCCPSRCVLKKRHSMLGPLACC